MTDARVCVTGCTSLGRHLSHCDSPDDQCRGCMPREAIDGLLCARCWGNLQRDVRTAPSIVDWIREHVEPSAQWGERVNSREIDAPAPLTVTAVDDADALHACLASWALLILEEHPSGLKLKVPGSRKSQATERLITLGAYRAWCDECGTVQHSDSRSTLARTLEAHDHAQTQIRPNVDRWSEVAHMPATHAGILPDSDATTSVAKFLSIHMEWASQQPWIAEMVGEVGNLVRTLLARYPHAERTRHLSDARCPVCERTTMTYTPPAWAGSDFLVQCDHRACGCIVPEDRFGLFMAMVMEDKKRELEESA